jgi:carbonic anhydrase/acetyltransferase-like protein (isoleucine patch superfamily)
MGSRLLDGVVVGEQSIIGAGALLTQGQQVPPGSLVLGAPAKISRSLSSEERADLRALAEKYVEIAAYYLRHGIAMAEHLK